MASKLQLLYHRQVAKNQKGFSVIEILVTVAIMTFVILGNTMFINDFITRVTRYEKESSDESQMAVLSVMAMNILKKSSLSFNRLTLTDDKGKNFFEYYPDLPQSIFGANGERIYTLSSANLNKRFYLISTEEGDFNSLSYDPMHAYDEISTPPDITKDGTIRYRGINTIPAIADDSGNMAKEKLMTKYFGERWAQGKIFVLTCPTYLRPALANNTINLMTPPRTASIITKVSSDDLVPLFNSEAGIGLWNYHPVTLAPYNSIDQFFRTIPVVGGASPFVKIEPALLTRFELRANRNYPSGYYDLFMAKWSPAGYKEEISVAEKIRSVEFKRKSVTLPLISMEILK